MAGHPPRPPRPRSRPDIPREEREAPPIQRIDRLAREYLDEFKAHTSSRPPPNDPVASAILESEQRIVKVLEGYGSQVESLQRSRETMSKAFGAQITDTGSFRILDENYLDATLLRRENADLKEKLAERQKVIEAHQALIDKWGDRKVDWAARIIFGIIGVIGSLLVFLLASLWSKVPH